MSIQLDENTTTDTKLIPPFKVVLLDDDDHSYYYVINMLRIILGITEESAYQMAEEVDNRGKVIVYTGPKEVSELKLDQIHSFGADRRLAWSAGSMSAMLEPA